jgi:hypothetical protein
LKPATDLTRISYCEFVLETDVDSLQIGFVTNTYDVTETDIGKRAISIGIHITPTLVTLYVNSITWDLGISVYSYTLTGLSVPLTAGTVFKFGVNGTLELGLYLGYNNVWFFSELAPFVQSALIDLTAMTPSHSVQYTLSGNIFPAISFTGADARVRVALNTDEFTYTLPSNSVQWEDNQYAEQNSDRLTSFLLNGNTFKSANDNYPIQDLSPNRLLSFNSYVETIDTPDFINDRSFVFNRSASSYIQFKNCDIFSPGNGDYTLDFYFARNSYLPTEFLLGSRNSDGKGFFIHIDHGYISVSYMMINDLTSPMGVKSCITKIQDFNEHHFAMVIKSGTIYLFLDGKLELERKLHSGVFGASNSVFSVGNAGNENANNMFSGTISVVRIYKGYARWIFDFTKPLVNDYIKFKSVKHTNYADLVRSGIDNTFISTPKTYEKGQRRIFTDEGRNISSGGKYYFEIHTAPNMCNSVGISTLDNINSNVMVGLDPSGSVGAWANFVGCNGTTAPVGLVFDYIGSLTYVIGVAVDCDNKTVTFRVRDLWLHNPYSGGSRTIALSDQTKTFFPCISLLAAGIKYTLKFATSADDMLFGIPNGYVAWDGSTQKVTRLCPPYLNGGVQDQNYFRSNYNVPAVVNSFYEVAHYTWSGAYTYTAGTLTNVKINYDFASPVILNRLFLLNYRQNSNFTIGVKDFSVYGTNIQSAFENTTYANTTDLVLLGTFTANMYIDTSGQYFYINNTTPYRYYVLRIANNHGIIANIGFHHIEFQYVADSAAIDTNALNLTISNTLFDDTFYDFPVFLNLCNSSGIGNFDASTIFTKLDVNYQKLWVTYNNEPIPVEVSIWDSVNKKARLFAKIPKVASNNSSLYDKQLVHVQFDEATGLANNYGKYSDSFTLYNYRTSNSSGTFPIDTSININGNYGIDINLRNSIGLSYYFGSSGYTITKDTAMCMQCYLYVREYAGYTMTAGTNKNIGIRTTFGGSILYLSYKFGVSVAHNGNIFFVTFETSNRNYVNYDTGFTASLNTLYHVAVVLKHRVLFLYIDGKCVFNIVVDNLDTFITTAFSVGGIYLYSGVPGMYESAHFIGTIVMPSFVLDDCLYYDEFVPPIEPISLNNDTTTIQLNFSPTNEINPNIGLTGSLVANDVWSDYETVFHFDKSSAGTVINSTGNGRNLSLNGAFVQGYDYMTFAGGVVPTFSTNTTDNDVLTVEIVSSFDNTTTYVQILNDTSGIGGTYSPYITYNFSSLVGITVWFTQWQTFAYTQNTFEHTYMTHNRDYSICGNMSLGVKGNGNEFTQDNMLRTTYSPFHLNFRANTTLPGNISYKELWIAKRNRSMDWIKASELSLKDELINYDNVKDVSEYVRYPLEGYEQGSVAEFSINNSGLTDTLTNFPLKLKMTNASGITNVDMSQFFDKLRVDSVVKGNLVKNYLFDLDNNVFNSMNFNNMNFGYDYNIKEDRGFTFDGSTDMSKVLKFRVDSINLATDLTVAFRFKLDTTTSLVTYGHYTIASFSTEYGGYFYIYPQTDNDIMLYWITNAIQGQPTTFSLRSEYQYFKINRGVWYSCVGVRKKLYNDPNVFEFSLYINGELVDRMTTTLSTNTIISTNSSEFNVGGLSTKRVFVGNIDSVIVTDVAFTYDDVLAYTNYAECKDVNGIHTILFEQDYSIPILKNNTLDSIFVDYTKDIVGDIYASVSFDTNTYYIYNTIWKAIVSRNDVIHGDTGNSNWHYFNGTTWIENTVNDRANTISTALSFITNRVPAVNTIDWDYGTSSFNALTGICDIACTIIYENNTNPISVLPSVKGVYFNNKKIKIFEPFTLSEYNGKITSSSVDWSYLIGNTFIDIEDKIRVYCKLSNSTTWVRCTNGSEIPVINDTLITTGLSLHTKAEIDLDSDVSVQDINVTVKIF